MLSGHKYYYITNNGTNKNERRGKTPSNIVCWTLDQGLTYYMTNNIDRLIDVSECNELIQLADGGTTLATYRGTYMGYISKKKIILCNVLYIPELKEI